MKTLTTDRLIIRDIKIYDIDDIYEYAKRENIGIHAGWNAHKDKNETLRIVKALAESGDVFAIVEKSSNKVIGTIGIHDDYKRKNPYAKSFGYVLSDDYWGQGIMPEACKAAIEYFFDELNVQILTVYHFNYNERSKRVIEKLGFTYEGKLKCSVVRFDGEVLDEMCYSMQKEDYINLYK